MVISVQFLQKREVDIRVLQGFILGAILVEDVGNRRGPWGIIEGPLPTE